MQWSHFSNLTYPWYEYFKNYPCHLNINFKYFNCIQFLNVLGFLQWYLLDGYINCLVLFSSDFIIRVIMALENECDIAFCVSFRYTALQFKYLNTLQSDHHHESHYHPSPRSWLSFTHFSHLSSTFLPFWLPNLFSVYMSIFMELLMVLGLMYHHLSLFLPVGIIALIPLSLASLSLLSHQSTPWSTHSLLCSAAAQIHHSLTMLFI